MSINDFVAMLMDVPPMLAGGWAVWFFVGLLLSIWTRREKLQPAFQSLPKHKSGVRAVTAFKASSGAPAPKPVNVVPLTAAGDAFSDLERLLEPESSHHIPGEQRSPVLVETQVLAAPQSLP